MGMPNLKDLQGRKLIEFKDIEGEVIGFYKELVGKSIH